MLWALLAGLLFGGLGILVQQAKGEIPASEMVFTRCVVGVVGLAPWVWGRLRVSGSGGPLPLDPRAGWCRLDVGLLLDASEHGLRNGRGLDPARRYLHRRLSRPLLAGGKGEPEGSRCHRGGAPGSAAPIPA